MSDDVIGKVADAAERAFMYAPHITTLWPDVARAAVAAHTDYLLDLGGVTDEPGGVVRVYDGYTERFIPVAEYVASAVAQAVADKDAEIQRLRVALVNIRHALGPDNLCSCVECDGLRVEAQAALDIARAALADEDGAA